MEKVLVIGLDGATFDLIKPWANQGYLPNIGRLMKEGIHGPLKSTIPPVTSPAWPSFMTGKNPGKHSIFEFFKIEDGITKIVSYNDIRSKCIWDLLSEAGKRSIVINVPVSYPPPPINGIVISGMLTPFGKEFTQPNNIEKEIKDNIGDYIIDLDQNVLSTFHKKTSLDKLYQMTEKRKDTTLFLMKKYNYDFCIVVFKGTDLISHRLWGKKEKVLDFYKKIDEYIGEFMQNIDPQTNIMLISDHGFGTIDKTIFINKWLEDSKFLKRIDKNLYSYYGINKEILKIMEKRGNKSGKRVGFINKLIKQNIIKGISSLGITSGKTRYYLSKLRLGFVLKFIPKNLKDIMPQSENINIDWNETKAYFYSKTSLGIVINVKGREPGGIVEPGREYEDLRNEIIKKLYELRDPENNEIIFEKVFKREELYSGPFLDKAPDIIFLPKDLQYEPSALFSDVLIGNNTNKGGHKLNGILIAKGQNLKEGKGIDDAELIDIAPTVLHMMGVPIPEDIDGKVLKGIFK